MKKTLLLATSAIVLSAWSARADFSVAPVNMSQWAGKYITLDGNELTNVSNANTNNVNRFVFDLADEAKLVGQSNYDGANKYWLVEIDETTGGMLLKNAVTGRYIGTIGQTDESQIPMLAADAAEGRGVFMAYEFVDNGTNYGYVLTTTQVRQGSTAGNPQSGTLMDNPNLSHEGENKGYADFGPNAANTNKLWLYCGVSTADVTPITNYGNPHHCSKWDITAYDSEASILNAHVTDAINARYPSAKDANKTAKATEIMSRVSADASFEEQYNAITEAVNELYTATPAANKFYRVSCPLFTTNKAMYVNGENLSWKTVDATDNSFIWSFVRQADGTYAMRNAVDGRYVSTVTGNNGQYKAQAAASSVTLQRISENDQQILIKHNLCMHCGGHGGGSGTNGDIIGWNTTGTAISASSWYLETISDEEDAALREHYLAPITSLPEWAQEEYAEQIAMMRNPETSTSDLMDAAFSLSNLASGNEYVGKVIKIRSSVSGRETKHACMGTTNLGARIKMADLNDGADPSDFLFYYTADHKLVHIASNRSFNSTLKACEYGTNAAEITLTPASTAHTYYVHTATYYAHEHGTTFDGCDNNNNSTHIQNHSLYIDVVESADIMMLLDKLPEPTVESAGFTLGNEPGQLIENTEFDWAARWAECKQNVANNFSLEAYAKLQDMREVGVGRYTVAPAQTGRMYRIKATPLNHKHNDCSDSTPMYLSNINNNNNTNNSCRSTFVTEPSDATVWFFAEGGYLMSVENGRYIVPNVTGNSPFMKLHASTLPASETATDHGALKIELSAANAPELGAYKITFPNHNNRSVHITMSKSNGVATSGEANCCSSAGNTDYSHNFYLEPVTELTATINQDGFGAFVAPVDVTFPQVEGFKAYTKQMINKVTHESKFMELRAGETVRAGVPVLLQGTPGETYTVNVVYSAADAPAAVNALSETESEDDQLIVVHGTNVAQLCAPDEGKAVYALSTTTSIADKGGEEEAVHFDKVEAGEQMPVGTMLLTVPSNHEIITSDGAKAVIGLTDTFTTGIKTIELHNLDGTVVIYDLQGRRLSAPAKGVNIINGKKVLVK